MKIVNKYSCSLMLSALLLASCTKNEVYYTEEELQYKTDSIIESKLDELEKAAQEDFDKRLPIELKVKLDSIFQVSYEIPAPPRLHLEEPDSNDLQPSTSKDTNSVLESRRQ